MTVRRRGVAALAAAVCLVVCVVVAGAQEPGSSPGTVVGGTVPSLLELSLDASEGFASFPARVRPRTYELAIGAWVTATDAPVALTIADGDAPVGARRGHLTSRSSMLPMPLQAAARGSAFRSLDAPVDPLLVRWGEPVANARARIRLRQRLSGGGRVGRGRYRKLVLITVGPEGP